VVEGVSGFNVCVLYAKALDDTIKRKNATIKVLAVQPTNWSPAEATKVTEDYVTRFKASMDAIFAHDDYIAGGVIVALKEAGYKPGQVKIVGVGGTGDALQAIKDGWMYGTVQQSPITEGEFEAKRAIEYLTKGKLDPFYAIMDNPKIDASNVNNYKAEF
jgi:ribose transport system substrate-binding protein